MKTILRTFAVNSINHQCPKRETMSVEEITISNSLGSFMPFSVRPRSRFPVYCPVTYQTGLFEGHGTVWNLSLAGWRFFLTLLVGCASVPSLPSQASFTQHILDP